MSADTPGVIVAFRMQVFVTQIDGVNILHLKRNVTQFRLSCWCGQKCVVVNVFFAAIYPVKSQNNIFFIPFVTDI